ncbi:hypothetical protein CpB0176 [Chlamydia pneumoniae TW-183]|uniref:Uncharacterized protein n=2 Tax=Chlamydia pneumoniae TaxID=83558 RepID=Q9Z911_CHLPN|nr:hypothetical protein CPn_0173 [Chlamydia pneumoniae CWL029]AAF38414.1 hypothetical protein CP_0597 [Chlamydia pneumoniae AR39]AAP98109.1 hypothetical protein CpB0176 [Chlamydia pneumoniae TW-183]BAA98383.1 hypothetical protein [Chlamydia pneumoniae J138]
MDFSVFPDRFVESTSPSPIEDIDAKTLVSNCCHYCSRCLFIFLSLLSIIICFSVYGTSGETASLVFGILSLIVLVLLIIECRNRECCRRIS